jgi:hypothetical protein
VFCNGPQVCDDVSGCVGSGNPCSDPQACDEAEADCGCVTPTVEAAGQRYLAITFPPTGAMVPTRLLVTPNCPLGVGKYLGAPNGPYRVSMLATRPNAVAVLTPGQWGGTVYVSGIDIAPGVEYQVQADCGVEGQPVLTAPATVQTPKWGDLVGWFPQTGYGPPPDGVVDVMDIVALVDAFKRMPGAVPMYIADLFGCIPNQIIDAIDIAVVVDAFKGLSYQSRGCAGPCW